jgi:hypothetical protein
VDVCARGDTFWAIVCSAIPLSPIPLDCSCGAFLRRFTLACESSYLTVSLSDFNCRSPRWYKNHEPGSQPTNGGSLERKHPCRPEAFAVPVSEVATAFDLRESQDQSIH